MPGHPAGENMPTDYSGARAVETGKGGKPQVRSYAELTGEGGTLGKYKRWKARPIMDAYWMLFTFEDELRLRYVPGGEKPRPVLTELGELEPMVPLEPDQPHLAVALIDDANPERTLRCVRPNPPERGSAVVKKVGEEQVALPEGPEVTMVHWSVTGDCGTFDIFLNVSGEPVRIEAGDITYERIW